MQSSLLGSSYHLYNYYNIKFLLDTGYHPRHKHGEEGHRKGYVVAIMLQNQPSEDISAFAMRIDCADETSGCIDLDVAW